MDLCCQIISLLFNTLSEFVIILFPRSKGLLISWLQSPFTVIFGAQENKLCYRFHFFPHLFALKWWAWISRSSFFECWVLRKLFHSLSSSWRGSLIPLCSLSTIRVVSSAYLRLLLFLPAVLILTWALSNLAFHMMLSAYKLNKQDDNIQPWHNPFPILNHSVFPYMVLTAASWPANRFLRRQISCFVIPISLRIVQFLIIDKVKDLSIVNEAEWDFFFFLEFPCLNLFAHVCVWYTCRVYKWKYIFKILRF